MTDTLESLTERLDGVLTYIRDADARISQGEALELTSLDDNVSEICEGIAALEAEDAKEMEPLMAQLIDGLDKLTVTIKEQQDSMDAS